MGAKKRGLTPIGGGIVHASAPASRFAKAVVTLWSLMTTRRLRRKTDLAVRLTTTKIEGRQHCWVVGCKALPGNASGDGLGRFCRKHLEHYRRHGDPLKGSYGARELTPHRRAAEAWLKANSDNTFVAAAIGGMHSEMLNAGPAIEPIRLRGLSADQKAKAVWARMREKGRNPTEVLAAVLAVAMRYTTDYQRAKPEHRTVQIGKALNRLGGGRVKRWNVHHEGAAEKVQTLRSFPASEGMVLRKLGERAERIAEFLIHDRMSELAEFSAQRRERTALRSLPFSGSNAS